jgi:hypothetical protein
MRATILQRQIFYCLLAVPIGFIAFYSVDWYWFDGAYSPEVVVGVSNFFSQLW